MPSTRLALAGLSHPFRSFTASRFWKIQLYADTVGVVEKELSVAGARHNLLAELDVVRLQPRAHAIDVGCGEGRFCRMLKAAGVEATGIDPTPVLLEAEMPFASARVSLKSVK